MACLSYWIFRSLERLARTTSSDQQLLNEWEEQYRSGEWKFLSGIAETGRFSVIAGYCNLYRPKTILDVGCGQGVLAGRIKDLPYERYLGVDFSSEAIKQANDAEADERTAFVIADAKTYRPTSRFDVIVFNECLYYFNDPCAVMQNFIPSLAPNGRVIVSMYKTIHNWSIWPMLEASMEVEDSIVVINRSKTTWMVEVMVPSMDSRLDPVKRADVVG